MSNYTRKKMTLRPSCMIFFLMKLIKIENTPMLYSTDLFIMALCLKYFIQNDYTQHDRCIDPFGSMLVFCLLFKWLLGWELCVKMSHFFYCKIAIFYVGFSMIYNSMSSHPTWQLTKGIHTVAIMVFISSSSKRTDVS